MVSSIGKGMRAGKDIGIEELVNFGHRLRGRQWTTELFHSKKVYNYLCRLSINSWQGLVNGNITFTDELDFDPAELDMVYEDNGVEEQ
jgi:hypothetical protein